MNKKKNKIVTFTDNVAGDSEEDRQARSLLNKFLGASVLMTSMEAANLCGESDKTGNKSNQVNYTRY